MVRKIITWIVTLWLIIMLAVLGISHYYTSVVEHPLKNVNGDKFVINPGDDIYKVIDNLNAEGKIKSGFLTKYYIKNHKNAEKLDIKPGQIILKKDMTIDDLLKALKNANEIIDPDSIKVTIPEGYTIEKMAKLFQDKGIISSKAFLESCSKYEAPSYVKADSKRKYALEGFLFPDTYQFKKGVDGQTIISTMLKRFEYVINELSSSTGVELGDDNIDKIITMASMVEGEVQKADERKLAASVFYNRLKKNMKLESCATVEYAIGVHKDKLSQKDYTVDSPYNTYLVPALPEGPICNPGKASIEAAIAPADTKYLYFVSRNDGTHEFNESYEKHLQAVRKYQSN